MKIIAAYLPQYHEIEENNRWWGKGYTDWVAVKNAEPQFKNHKQPRIPMNDEYYSLDDKNVIKRQADLAKKYGVYGFAIYHYWFSSQQQLLTKPAEILLENKDIDINFFLVWDNNSWVNKTWKNVRYTNQWAPRYETDTVNNDGMLAEVKYGNEIDWENHYNYLKCFFEDDRYIKEEGKPILGVFSSTNNKEILTKMCNYINSLAVKDGYPGIIIISAATFKRERIGMDFRYEPFNVCSPLDFVRNRLKKRQKIKVYDYDSIWKKIILNAKFLPCKKTFYGAFVRYDDTPRRGEEANIVINDSPEKFQKYMSKLIEISKKQGKKYIYLTAWNEWGEGAYLEPDSDSGFGYLEALSKAIKSNEDKR